MAVWLGLTALSLLAWIVLAVGRGGFWRLRPLLEPAAAPPGGAPAVVAVIPARDEADVLPETLPSVLMQDYTGPFRVILVDDRSIDGTTAAAREAGAACAAADRLTILSGEPLPKGWAGKLWALQQGAAYACENAPEGGRSPEYLWFTDADIAHEPWVLNALVARSASGLNLVSAMAKLRVRFAWDRLLVPAFVYFFAKLYPFRLVGNPRRRNAGAAGGCILVRREALERAGGLEAIRCALIDDCALGRLIKQGGPIWLGFSRGVRSVRGYGLSAVWRMVARSAYTQLGHSPLAVIGTAFGMLFLYALPPTACLGGAIGAALGVPGALRVLLLGAATWALMSATFVPILRHHEVAMPVAPFLPVAGVLYVGMVISSAWQHARGRGGAWKGRTY